MLWWNSLRFGTNDEIQLDLMRYGEILSGFDEILWDSMRFGEIHWDMVRFYSKYGCQSAILDNIKNSNHPD